MDDCFLHALLVAASFMRCLVSACSANIAVLLCKMRLPEARGVAPDFSTASMENIVGCPGSVPYGILAAREDKQRMKFAINQCSAALQTNIPAGYLPSQAEP